MRGDSLDLLKLSLAIFVRVFILLISYPIVVNSVRDFEIIYNTISSARSLSVYLQLIGLMMSSLISLLALILVVIPRPALATIMMLFVISSERYDVREIILSIIVLVSLLLYDVFNIEYRSGELNYVRSLSKGYNRIYRIVWSITLVLILVVLLPYVSVSYLNAIVSIMMSSLKPYNIYEEPIIGFITRNPVGISIFTIVILLVLSLLVWGFYSVTALYILKPSKTLIDEFFGDIASLDIYYKSPLNSLRDLFIAILLAPFTYTIVISVIDRILRMSITSYDNVMWSSIVALISFILSWILSKAIFSIISLNEVSLRRVLVGVFLILMIYLTAYLLWNWNPSEGVLRLTPVDNFISSTIYNYYYMLYYLIETIGVVMGFVP